MQQETWHLTEDYRTKTMRTPRFDGHYYNCKKYGHRDFECISKPMCAPNQPAKTKSHGHHYNWDYNNRQSCHYCQEYENIPENYIRTHFSGNYNRWLSQTTFFSFLKTGHISKFFPTKSKAPNSEFNKGKEKVDVEYIRGEMNRTWKRRYGDNTSNGGITSPKRSSGHTSSN